VRKPKRRKSPRNSNTKGHAQITRKGDSKKKSEYTLAKTKKKDKSKKSGKRKDERHKESNC
jgi:hypothetical protein